LLLSIALQERLPVIGEANYHIDNGARVTPGVRSTSKPPEFLKNPGFWETVFVKDDQAAPPMAGLDMFI